MHMTYKTFLFVLYSCVWCSPVAWRRYLKPSPQPGRREPSSGSLPSYRDSETALYSYRWVIGLEVGVWFTWCTSSYVVIPVEWFLLPDDCCSRCVYCTSKCIVPWESAVPGDCVVPGECLTAGEWCTRPMCRTGECCTRPVCRTGECCTRPVCRTGECCTRPVCRNRRVRFTMWLLWSRWMFYWTRRTQHITIAFHLLCSSASFSIP